MVTTTDHVQGGVHYNTVIHTEQAEVPPLMVGHRGIFTSEKL